MVIKTATVQDNSEVDESPDAIAEDNTSVEIDESSSPARTTDSQTNGLILTNQILTVVFLLLLYHNNIGQMLFGILLFIFLQDIGIMAFDIYLH